MIPALPLLIALLACAGTVAGCEDQPPAPDSQVSVEEKKAAIEAEVDQTRAEAQERAEEAKAQVKPYEEPAEGEDVAADEGPED